MRRKCLLMMAVVGMTLCCANTAWAQMTGLSAGTDIDLTPSDAATVNVTFAGTGVTGEVGTVTYSWDFDDANDPDQGSIVSGGNTVTPVYQYIKAGTYIATLTATDPASTPTTVSDQVTVTILIKDTDILGYVPQNIGRYDGAFTGIDAAGCQVSGCHDDGDAGLADKHHNLYGTGPVSTSMGEPPFESDADQDTVTDASYSCLNCHYDSGGAFPITRDCVLCHLGSPHHTTATVAADCAGCHGSVVEYNVAVPTYNPFALTPSPTGGISGYVNTNDVKAGACDFCHGASIVPEPDILATSNLHHNTGVLSADQPGCEVCHDSFTTWNISPASATLGSTGGDQMRQCEICHSRQSLHSIQADTAGDADSTGSVGTETAGAGHVGRSAGSLDSDCFGCHGGVISAAGIAGPSGSDTIVPTIYFVDKTVVAAGVETQILVVGAEFINSAGSVLYESVAMVTADDGFTRALATDATDGTSLIVTIPSDLAAGNYLLRAVKFDEESNPISFTVTPKVVITSATAKKSIVTISGSGFGGYADAPNSGTSCTGIATVKFGKGKNAPTEEVSVEVTVISWEPTEIVVDFADGTPISVTVNSVFGSTATADVTKGGNGGGGNGNGGGKGRNK